MQRSSRSLQDLDDIRAQLQTRLAQKKAREQAIARKQKQPLAERTQFSAAVGSVKPLRGDHAQRVRNQQQPPPPQPLQRERDHAAVLQEALSDAIDTSTLLETDEQLSYKRPEIGADVLRKLRRGHWSIQRQLDLHGLRRDAAREALSIFIRDCQRQGLRCIRIITGKGLGSPGQIPVLKHKVHGWLTQKQDVLAFVQARANDGGAGALIVLLASSSRNSP